MRWNAFCPCLVGGLALLAMFTIGCVQSRSMGVSAEEVCTAASRCLTIDREMCVMQYDAEFDRADGVGCTAQATAIYQCMNDVFVRAADEGTCDSVRTDDCNDASIEYIGCLREGGLARSFFCDNSDSTLRQCNRYEEAVTEPEATCDGIGATLVDSCPTDDVLGSCTTVVLGTTLTMTYYSPLPTGLTVDALERICNGVWMAGS